MNLWLPAFILALIAAGYLSARLVEARKLLGRLMARRRELFRRTPEFLLILDGDMRVKEVSRSVIRIFRGRREDFIGRPVNLTPIWPVASEGIARAVGAYRTAVGGSASVFSLEYDGGGPGPLRLEIKVFPVGSFADGSGEIICVAKDVTRELASRENLSRRMRVEGAIDAISRAALGDMDVRESVPGMLRQAGETLRARRAFFFRTVRNGGIVWKEVWDSPGLTGVQDDWQDIVLRAITPYRDSGDYVTLSRIQDNPAIDEQTREAALRANVGSLLFTPLSGGRELFGYVGFTFETFDPPRDDVSSIILRLLSSTLTGLMQKSGVRRDMELFRQSVNAAGQGIALIENEGGIVYANRTYTELTGLGPGSSRRIWDIYTPVFAEKVRKLILPLALSGQHWTGELKIVSSAGAEVNTIESFHPVDTGLLTPRYVVSVVTDITDRIRLESQLIAARKEAELANRAKSEYLATMSHEIRTPMNAVIGLTYLALQTDLDNRQRDYMNKISTSAKSLLAIINDILDLSKIESGGLELESAPYSIDDVLDSLGDMVVDRAWEKGLMLLFERSPDVADLRIGDRHRLGQILLNLVSNAIKFTSSGRVILRVEPDGSDRLRFVVEDTGIGMTDEQIARLFRPFSQAEASTTRRFGGTGLGLTISRRIAVLMGGDISVTSEPDRGSRFVLAVPSPVSGDAPVTLPRGEAVVVCADPDAGGCHRRTLESAGYRTVLYDRVADAIGHSGSPAVLLMDADACCRDPLKAAVILSEGMDEDFILVISGSRPAPELAGLLPSDVKGLTLPLPYSPARLADSIDRAIGIRSGHTVPDGADPAPPPAGAIAIRGRILLADDNEINRQVGRELIMRAGLVVDVVNNGREAVEACERHLYDAVFLDLNMPEMNGREAALSVRGRRPEQRVVAMTASALGDVGSLRDSGFTHFIAKPIDPVELYRLLGDILGMPVTAGTAMETRGDTSGAADPAIPGLDTRTGLKHVLGDRQAYRRMLSTFAEDYRRSAPRLAEAVRDGRSDEIISILHSIRGSAGHIGADGLRADAGAIEEALRRGEPPDRAAIDTLMSGLNQLTEAIVRSGPVRYPSVRLDELEKLLRNGDPAASAFLDDLQTVMNGEGNGDVARADEIRRALSLSDYDAALDSLDRWRSSIGSREVN